MGKALLGALVLSLFSVPPGILCSTRSASVLRDGSFKVQPINSTAVRMLHRERETHSRAKSGGVGERTKLCDPQKDPVHRNRFPFLVEPRNGSGVNEGPGNKSSTMTITSRLNSQEPGGKKHEKNHVSVYSCLIHVTCSCKLSNRVLW